MPFVVVILIVQN